MAGKASPQEYFTQRTDRPGINRWKLDQDKAPPLEIILARPAQPLPPYGVYCWANEYARAHDEISKIGFKSIRLSGPWKHEDKAMRLAAENGMEVLYTMAAGSEWPAYKEKRRPHFDSDAAFIAAMSDNVKAFLETYGKDGSFFRDKDLESPVAVVEIWNEPNFKYMIPDSGNQQQDEAAREALYPKVLKAGYEAVKSVDPDMLVAGFAAGGAAKADVRFIDNIHQAHPDINGYYDILSTHPYMHGAPPEAFKLKPWGGYSIAGGLEEIREDMGDTGMETPVWYTEIGWRFSHADGGHFRNGKHPDHIVPIDLHAAYIVRTYLWAIRLGVDRILVMHLHDSDSYNGGFIDRKTFAWRPVAYATQHLIERMPHPRLNGAISDGEDGTYIYRYDPDHTNKTAEEMIVAWNLKGPKTVNIPVSQTGTVTAYDMIGNRRELPVVDGAVELETGPYPLYLELD